MASRHSDVLSPASGRQPAEASRRSPWIRRWAWLGIAAQVVFVAGVLVATSWQGPHYSVLRDSISDMYAVTAPHGTFLVQLLTDTGAATILFALLAVWPALRSGGRAAAIGSVLLALSIGGLGDLLSPAERLACRMADPGCTMSLQLSNSGGKMDNILSDIGVLLLVLACFFLAHAMARPTRATAVLIIALTIADALTEYTSVYGLFERLVAATMAVALTALGIGILRRSRPKGAQV
jgi:hypothetical protein